MTTTTKPRAPRRRWPWVVLVVALLVGVVGGLVDREIQARTTSAFAVAVRDAVTADGTTVEEVTVTLDSVPFVPRLLAGGRVSHASIALRDVVQQGVRYETVDADIDQLRVSVGAMLRGEADAIRSVGRVDLRAVITEESASAYSGYTVQFEPERVTVEINGVDLPATATIEDRSLLIGAAGFPPTVIPLPDERYLPCELSSVIEFERMVVTCVGSELPPIFFDPLSSGSDPSVPPDVTLLPPAGATVTAPGP